MSEILRIAELSDRRYLTKISTSEQPRICASILARVPRLAALKSLETQLDPTVISFAVGLPACSPRKARSPAQMNVAEWQKAIDTVVQTVPEARAAISTEPPQDVPLHVKVYLDLSLSMKPFAAAQGGAPAKPIGTGAGPKGAPVAAPYKASALRI